jgi:hypothetical protein
MRKALVTIVFVIGLVSTGKEKRDGTTIATKNKDCAEPKAILLASKTRPCSESKAVHMMTPVAVPS